MMRPFILAVRFLTRLPTPQIGDFTPEDQSRSAAFFPAVGMIVGAIVGAAVAALAWIDPWAGALAGVVLWVWVTGGLHLDGLGDVTDAFGAAHRDPQRFLDVLRDPHIGAFGVMAITLQITAKLVLLASLARASPPWAILLVPAWARWGALVWSHAAPPLKTGLAERFSSSVGRATIIGWGVALALASVWVEPWLLAAIPAVTMISLYWRRRLGGVTGDCLGAGIEVTESLLLLALVAAGVSSRAA